MISDCLFVLSLLPRSKSPPPPEEEPREEDDETVVILDTCMYGPCGSYLMYSKFKVQRFNYWVYNLRNQAS